MKHHETRVPMRRPPANIDATAVQAALVMVNAFRLSTDADGADGIFRGVINGLASLVHYDTAVVDGGRRRLRHTYGAWL